MMTAEPRTFLQSKFNLTVILLVIFTTVFSWMNLNSWSIILLVGCRLFFENPQISIRKAFRNGLFLSYLIYGLVETAGFLHTHHPAGQADMVAKDATLVAIAYVLCAGRFANREGFRQLLTGYYIILVGASVYCLIAAVQNYLNTGDTAVFFYHPLTRPISQNAVFFSVYVVFGLLLVISPDGNPAAHLSSPRIRAGVRMAVALFFTGMVVLLNSKLMLVIALLILLNALFRKFSFRKNRRPLLVTGSILLTVILLLGMTDNPISSRYRDLAAGDLQVVRRATFDRGMYFNPLQLRLLEWRFAFEILKSRNAWWFGVSPGDSQVLLDEKYVATNMYIGNPADGPHRKVRGFIGYNFHNQYLETTVRDGIAGLLCLLIILGLQVRLAVRSGTPQALFVVSTIILLFIPEAPLTMQHGIFLFCFFPPLLLYGPKNGQ